jgi:hypothetical protein
MADDGNDICFIIYQHAKQEAEKAAAAGASNSKVSITMEPIEAVEEIRLQN